MPRPRRNPFYAILCVTGVVFTITATSYCLSVLRGVRPETAAGSGAHPLERIMDRYGTAILTGELAPLLSDLLVVLGGEVIPEPEAVAA